MLVFYETQIERQPLHVDLRASGYIAFTSRPQTLFSSCAAASRFQSTDTYTNLFRTLNEHCALVDPLCQLAYLLV